MVGCLSASSSHSPHLTVCPPLFGFVLDILVGLDLKRNQNKQLVLGFFSEACTNSVSQEYLKIDTTNPLSKRGHFHPRARAKAYFVTVPRKEGTVTQ